MRRFVSVVLMLVLLLQASWSAAAAVCQHEPVAAESHFGHHVHPDAQVPAETGNGNGPQVPHLDCVGCHGGMCAVLLGWPAALATGLPDVRHATPYRRSITDGLPERLIRPPHRFLA